jgi:hypothetical protein
MLEHWNYGKWNNGSWGNVAVDVGTILENIFTILT